jgi:dTDP-4-dehydrorhamnose reductase
MARRKSVKRSVKPKRTSPRPTKKKKVLLLGATGMLGSAVYDVLKDKYDLVLTVRNPEKIELLEQAYGGTKKHRVIVFDAARKHDDFVNKKGYPGEYLTSFMNEVGDVDYVINAIGITIPFALENPPLTYFINGALPHILSRVYGPKLIHITTDCAFNGKEGYPYDENSPKTPVDLYGLTKSLGEPTNCLTTRTSMIGPELEGHTGLLDWFLQQGGKEINGFAGHFWNGVTTKQYGKIIDQIMSNPDAYPKTGLYHVFSTTVNKYDMCQAFKKKFGINVTINRDDQNKLNRTLSTIYDFNQKLDIPSFQEMVDDL